MICQLFLCFKDSILILAFHARELEQESLAKTIRKDKSADLEYFLLTLFSAESFEREVSAALQSRPGTRQFHAVGRGGVKITDPQFFTQLLWGIFERKMQGLLRY